MSDNFTRLWQLYHSANEAPKAEAPAAWAAYHALHQAEEARRDRSRVLYEAGANAFMARVERIHGVTVEKARYDDFGRVSLTILIDGARYWTRPSRLADEKAFARVRDAVAAVRRKDWRSARRQLAMHELHHSIVQWDRIDQVMLDRNEYSQSHWRERQ